MMEKMGYKKDTGLGRLGQGRVAPVEAAQQKGRRGLGMRLDDLDRAADKWDPTIEELFIPEQVEWLINSEPDDALLELSADTLSSWIRRGPKVLTIENETNFCDENILKRVLESKSVFDNLGADDMRRARTKSNPFETIRGNIFQNRAAVKMANMDSMFDFMFTNPVDDSGKSMLGENDLLYFADVCAGPGGFSEYVLYRKKWEAKGFGFTLKAENDFKLHEFFAGSPETFSAFYGINEDGDVYDPENIRTLEELIQEQTESGVHFMMADGGFSVEGQENIQEILSKQLYLAQCLVALSIVRTKGHFVVKLFDLFTPFSASLIFLMYKCFQRICVCKPNTSRPANSERYLVCKWKKPYTDTVQRNLFEINRELQKYKRDGINDILEMVPLDVMQQDQEFYNYLISSNNIIGKNQIVGLVKIAAYCHDPELIEKRQSETRKQCLKLWKLPDESRKKPVTKTSEQYCAQLLEQKWFKEKFMMAAERSLESIEHVRGNILSVLDWYFVGVDDIIKSSKNRTFFMSRGRFDVMMLNTSTHIWEPIQDRTLEMSPETLIYGEIVKELIGENRSQVSAPALHIIDGIILGGKDIRHLCLAERNQMCQKFARSLTKPIQCNGNNSMPIRCKRLFKITDMESFFEQLVPRHLKDGCEKMGYDIKTNNSNNNNSRFHIPRGLLFLDEVRSDRFRCFSSTHNKIYYFDKITKKTFFPEDLQPSEMYASFRNTYTTRLIWKFEIREQILEHVDPTRRQNGHLYREDLTRYIESKMPQRNL